MHVRTVDPAHIDAAVIDEAASIIRGGGLVAFPTETVYGLGADATNARAVAGIFAAKGRPVYNPLIVHVADVTDVAQCVTAWPEVAARLAERFWPGPLTLVLPKHPRIPDIVSAGLPTVGVRVPAHPVALALLRAAGVPVAAPSANRSMEVSPTRGEHVTDSLGDAADLILDAGPSSVGIESTVLDLTSAIPTILRPGMISRASLSEILGEVALAGEHFAEGQARPSPGMTDRHYSPRAALIVAPSAGWSGVDKVLTTEARNGLKVLVLAREDFLAPSGRDVRRLPNDPDGYARLLYSTLRAADGEGYGLIIVEPVPPDAAWDGVRDRLRRASR